MFAVIRAGAQKKSAHDRRQRQKSSVRLSLECERKRTVHVFGILQSPCRDNPFARLGNLYLAMDLIQVLGRAQVLRRALLTKLGNGD